MNVVRYQRPISNALTRAVRAIKNYGAIATSVGGGAMALYKKRRAPRDYSAVLSRSAPLVRRAMRKAVSGRYSTALRKYTRASFRKRKRVRYTRGAKGIEAKKRSFVKRDSFTRRVNDVLDQSKAMGWYFKQSGSQFDATALDHLYNSQGNSVVNGDWNFFGPNWVLDAASVLFGVKTPDYDHNLTLNNINDLSKIYVERQWVQFTFVSNKEKDFELEFYVLEPRVRKAAEVTNTNSELDTLIAKGGAPANQCLYFGFPPSFSKNVLAHYSIQRKCIVLRPGETHKEIVYGRKGWYNFEYMQDKQIPRYNKIVWVRGRNCITAGETGGTAACGYMKKASGAAGRGIGIATESMTQIRCPESITQILDVQKFLQTGMATTATNEYVVNTKEPSVVLTNPR